MSEVADHRFSVIILAAGKGKRMNNPTQAKVMALVGNKPLICHVLDQVDLLNPDRTILVVGHQKESVIGYVNSLGNSKTGFVVQNEQLGTGHAVDQAEPFFFDYPGSILILSGDVPLLKAATLKKFIDKHHENKAVISVLSTFTDNPFGYGRIIRNDEGSFTKIIEEKDANDTEKQVNEINSGIYIVNSRHLFSSLKEVSNKNAQGEYYLTDIIEIIRNKNLKTEAFPLAEFGELQGVNSVEDLRHVEETFLKR